MDRPNYHQIYLDIIHELCPHQLEKYSRFFLKSNLTYFEVIALNDLIFNPLNDENTTENQKFKAYHKDTIFTVLNYQKLNNISNSKLSRDFNISRNTIAKWKKHYIP